MATLIDTQGLSCPEPVLRTKQALASKEAEYEILVDNNTAKQNVTRFAESAGYAVTVAEDSGIFHLQLRRK